MARYLKFAQTSGPVPPPNTNERLCGLIRGAGVVLQAPALCHVAHELGCPVVMMRGSPCGIRKSEDRVHWRTLYDALNLEVEQEKHRLKYHLFSEEIALLKCFVWDTV